MPKLHNVDDTNYKSFGSNVGCICSFLVFCYFFYGLIIYPLSDLFAIMLCGLAIVLELKLETINGVKEFAVSFLLGAVLYFSYNVRTIYLFSGIWLFSKLIFYLIKSSKTIVNKCSVLMVNIAGIVVAAIPQIYINYNMLGKISLAVPTNGLMLKQLAWGIKYQRYDTFVGIDAAHPNPQVYFIDPVGSTLMESIGINTFERWSDFFKFFLDHPLEMIGIYTRHIINAMFPCWPNQYVMELNNSKIVCAIISIFVFFIFCVALMNKMIKGEIIERYISLLIPVLFIMCGAVEIRFFAAGYLFVIGVLCYNVDWKNMKRYVIENRWKELILLVIFGCILITQWSSMLVSESECNIFLQ